MRPAHSTIWPCEDGRASHELSRCWAICSVSCPNGMIVLLSRKEDSGRKRLGSVLWGQSLREVKGFWVSPNRQGTTTGALNSLVM